VSESVKATFNYQTHTKASLRQFFTGVNSVVSANYKYLKINPNGITVLANPNDIGGQMMITGDEYGVLKTDSDDKVRTEKDALYAVIGVENGERKFVEWREFTNFI
jgi:hypothetical protein